MSGGASARLSASFQVNNPSLSVGALIYDRVYYKGSQRSLGVWSRFLMPALLLVFPFS